MAKDALKQIAVTIWQQSPNLWRVTGSQPEPYIVNLNHNVLHCNCKGNYLGHRRCRHIAAVEEFIKQELLTAP